jgi:hypothetical protein
MNKLNVTLDLVKKIINHVGRRYLYLVIKKCISNHLSTLFMAIYVILYYQLFYSISNHLSTLFMAIYVILYYQLFYMVI